MKGKIIVGVVSALLSIGVVTAFLGVEVVDGPEGAVCFAAANAEGDQ